MVDRGGMTQRPAHALAAAALVLAISSCTAASPPATSSSAASESGQPTATTSASESATSAPPSTPGFEAPAGILPPNSRATVTLEGLRVRDAPGLEAGVRDTLAAGTVVEIVGTWGPIPVDGIDWYWVVPDVSLAGYAAVASGGDRYLELLPPRCQEGEPDLPALLAITPWERLACFGDRSITVTGTYGCPVCGAEPFPGTYEPSWLASPLNLYYIGWPNAITLHFPPAAGLDAPPNASVVRVTGHFSDRASTTCVIRDPPGQYGAPVNPVSAELWCREQFVLDAYEITGTDPDFSATPRP